MLFAQSFYFVCSAFLLNRCLLCKQSRRLLWFCFVKVFWGILCWGKYYNNTPFRREIWTFFRFLEDFVCFRGGIVISFVYYRKLIFLLPSVASVLWIIIKDWSSSFFLFQRLTWPNSLGIWLKLKAPSNSIEKLDVFYLCPPLSGCILIAPHTHVLFFTWWFIMLWQVLCNWGVYNLGGGIIQTECWNQIQKR